MTDHDQTESSIIELASELLTIVSGGGENHPINPDYPGGPQRN